jgi:hypothetical protein
MRATRRACAELGLARRRRSPGRKRRRVGDDQWVPLVSGSGEGEGAARAAGPAGPRSVARELGCGGLLLRGLGCSECWVGLRRPVGWVGKWVGV